MIKSLHQLVSIESGMAFRSRVEHDPSGSCSVIQMKDISETSYAIEGSPSKIQLDAVDPSKLLNTGDLLFVAKGNRNVVVRYQFDTPAVAVALFYVIRTGGNRALSDYLLWYLNSPTAQNYFHAHRRGASVGNIRIDDLKKLEVPVLDSKKQQVIGNLFSKFMEEKELMRQLIEKREVYIQNSLNTLIRKQS